VTATKSNVERVAMASAPVGVLDITVLAGGPSAEREVSLDSGAAVAAALARLNHRVTVCDIGPDDLTPLDRRADFVFIALHGEFGEDGTVQSLLEERGLRFSGCGSAASRLAMDKVAAKRRFAVCGVPTPPFEVVDRDGLGELERRVSLPVVVKPISSGSSVDTTIARSAEAYRSAAESVVGKYGSALVERFVAGRELTVGILGDAALPVCEIRTKRDFYDYQAKYIDNDTDYLFDFDLSDSVLDEARRVSLLAHRSLGCSVFSRVDLMWEAATNELFVLEVNTIPGFTSHSLVPKAASRVGVSFDELCRRVIELSWAEPR